jgi:putative ABC transport system substrate-binding protein
MRRREFIVVVGGAAAWPLATRARADRVRRIGVLMAAPADDPEYQARIVALVQRLQQLGWADGSNVRIDTRWAPDPSDLRRHAAELVELAPDVIVAATGTTTIAPLLQATRRVPIVFVLAIDPVGAGFVGSLSRPGGNATGFTMFEYGMSAKWLELLKEIAPRVRAIILRDPTVPQGIGQFAVLQAVAAQSGWICGLSTGAKLTRSSAPFRTLAALSAIALVCATVFYDRPLTNNNQLFSYLRSFAPYSG